MALEMASANPVLYVSGEESERQIKMRAMRLLPAGRPGRTRDSEPCPEDLFLVTETNLEVILEHVSEVKPALLVVDSIQTTTLPDARVFRRFGVPGARVRLPPARAGQIHRDMPCSSSVTSPKKAPSPGRACWSISWIRCCTWKATASSPTGLLRSVKNRFGATSEVGVFEMRERGMVEVPNPSEAFLAERMVNAPGSAIAVTMEGTRPLLVEIQGLTSPTSFGNPRRTPNGVDFNRLLLDRRPCSPAGSGCAWASRMCLSMWSGGITIDEPAADLAVAAAIASSA